MKKSGNWKSTLKGRAIQVSRLSLLVGILWCLHHQHLRRVQAVRDMDHALHSRLPAIQQQFPQATSIEMPHKTTMVGQIVDKEGNALGYAVETSPQSDDIIGFSGPTNLLILFHPNNEIEHIEILESQDTREHVQLIKDHPDFLASFKGQTWEEASSHSDVDAISGATLTSWAIVESICNRLGGAKPSLKFPKALQLSSIQKLFPAAASFERLAPQSASWTIFDREGNKLGRLIRTSVLTETVIGYQGPTDLFVALDSAEDKEPHLTGFLIDESYDNEPYVGYVRDDEYFHSLFENLTLSELAKLNLEEAEIEGVSGATMTSLSVAETLIAAAIEEQLRSERNSKAQPNPTSPETSWWNDISWNWKTVSTLGLIGCGLVLAFTSLRGIPQVRIGFQLLLIFILGIQNGDLLSIALWGGWVQHGIPWKSAFSLLLLSVAALAVPLFTKRNLYCHHLCPHGALQQLIRNNLPWKISLSPRISKWLGWLPGMLLLVTLVILLRDWQFGLVNLEAFDAWLFPVAGTLSIIIAVAGLMASLVVPMAYCRFGCPTGAILKFVTYQGKGERFQLRDGFAFVCFLLALLLTYWD